ncbi:glutamyl-tRNA reductase [Bacillaceae bacterium SIJ1]|uniref:glutamyl-tRNA reductase n=1 Tax=Litoribacterium kuwaitense TaxID=1398745 RepID=UPI0013ED86DC|nr:glutamyl-tRNA reductase [Litoribacterium kuwaitense]NGP45505.1 glutamyl-tRNA reductase [Litoribacterium kuwaitense]
MHILAMSLHYKKVPVEFRERVAFDKESLPHALKALKGQKSILENVIVSTCNRTEIYAVTDQAHTGRYYMRAFLADWFGVSIDQIKDSVSYFENKEAVDHLLRVTSGLDSMVVGETQILGQIRDSFLTAQSEKTTGTVFNQLFKQAITFAKRAHSDTSIGEQAVSVGYAAVELGKKIFGSLKDKHVLLIGAGKMSELAAKNLQGQGVGSISVLNRTYARAEEVAAKFEGRALQMHEAESALAQADILISSTNASGYVISKPMLTNVEKKRKGKPLFLIDIAVPRDIDPQVHELEHTFLYDIDDLEGIVQSNRVARDEQAEIIVEMMEKEVQVFLQWLDTLGVVPMITSLREKALDIQAETMKSIERKMPDLTEREKKVLNKHTKSIVNQLLKGPIMKVKEKAGQPGSEEALQLFAEMFELLEDPAEEPAASSDNVVTHPKGQTHHEQRDWQQATAGT